MTELRPLGVLMCGVTGRMGRNQHLIRSILAIQRDGGVVCDGGRVAIMPQPILCGRSADRLRALAAEVGPDCDGRPLRWTTEFATAVRAPEVAVVFDASTTRQRPQVVEAAAAAGKAVYCEKPTAEDLATALRLAERCEQAGVKNGVVQDKLFLPGVRKLQLLIRHGFFGRILSVRGEFGYWVFAGDDPDQPAQRPSWNYRGEDGGGIVLDMFCHWRYLIDATFGTVDSVYARVCTEVGERWDESGRRYAATADDAAYAVLTCGDGITVQINSSWNTRVRRDDLLTLQVDGTAGSAVAGLRQCRVQSLAATPKPVWNPDLPQAIDFFAGWQEVPDAVAHGNAFRAQWEWFLRHVVADEPWPFPLRKGAEGVQLAELALRSSREGRVLEVPPLG